MYPGETVLFEEWYDKSYDYGMEILRNREGKLILRIWSAGFNTSEIDHDKLVEILKIMED